jgi:hypothetical protein
MKTFRQFLEETEDLRSLYASMLNPKDIEMHKRLSAMVQDAYRRGDHETAERLDAQLEELEERLDSQLEEMDDGDMEEDRGEEERDLDRDWSVQDDMASIYARYLAGELDLGYEDTVEVDPEEAKRKGWEIRQGMDHNGKGVGRFYRYVPITRQAAFAKMLRGAIWESPNLSISNPDVQKIKSMNDEQIIAAAKDAYEWKSGLRGRIGRSSSG